LDKRIIIATQFICAAMQQLFEGHADFSQLPTLYVYAIDHTYTEFRHTAIKAPQGAGS
jgi:hypothetical protein